VDTFTIFCALERQFGTETAQALIDRATQETTVALSDEVWLLGYHAETGPRYDIVGVTA
jgi:hypothetical protein